MKRKWTTALLAMLMGLSLMSGCGSKGITNTTKDTAKETAVKTEGKETEKSSENKEAAPADEDGIFGISAFDKEEELNVGFFAGSALSMPFYVADREGFWEKLNIKINYETYTNGPAMMEANADWDLGGAGSAGVLVGNIGYDLPMIGVSDYEENQAIFVRPDSPIAKDPANPENWKGTTWLYPSGTTAHLVLSKQLEKIGLSTNDINSVNMDVSSALNAFKGGEGDGLAVWNAFSFQAEDAGFVRIANSGSLNIVNSSGTLVNPASLKTKKDLILKAWALYYRTVDWMKENPDKAVEYYLESCEDEGIAVTEDIAKGIMSFFKAPGFADSVKVMSTEVDDLAGQYTKRKLLKAEADLLVAMDFFIEQGKYKPEDRNKLLDNHLVDPSIAKEANELYGK